MSALHKALQTLCTPEQLLPGASSPVPRASSRDGEAEGPTPDMLYEFICCYLGHCTAALNLHIPFTA